MSSNCWAWGVQKRLARSECAKDVTALVQCCSAADLDGRERLNSIRKIGEGGDMPCDKELDMVKRCLPGALLELGGSSRAFETCEKDFRAVTALPSDEQKALVVLNRAWSCAWRSFRQPLEQLIAQAQAVGECRPAAPVTAGKGQWTA